jgi:hypothetical protein
MMMSMNRRLLERSMSSNVGLNLSIRIRHCPVMHGHVLHCGVLIHILPKSKPNAAIPEFWIETRRSSTDGEIWLLNPKSAGKSSVTSGCIIKLTNGKERAGRGVGVSPGQRPVLTGGLEAARGWRANRMLQDLC